ncbi:MAG: IclR family transcriptional regulator [Propionibacteriaceae bacterium]|nr:IclR family transcriptional regulator [Propionibacteriaceae bacterium]
MSVLGKATEIIEAIGRVNGASRLGDLASELGMPKSSLHRLLVEMVNLGVLWSAGDGTYQLGPRLIRWGRMAGDSFDLPRLAKPVMQALRDETDETVNLYVPVEYGRVCVASEPGNRALQHNPLVGLVRPAGRGAAGKLVMAYASADERTRIRDEVSGALPSDAELDELKHQRFAVSTEEMEPGLVVMGTPVVVVVATNALLT